MRIACRFLTCVYWAPRSPKSTVTVRDWSQKRSEGGAGDKGPQGQFVADSCVFWWGGGAVVVVQRVG